MQFRLMESIVLMIWKQFFARVISGEDIHIENLKLNFLESIDFKFFGNEDKYNGTLPAGLVQGICEFQTEMYKVLL